MLHLEHYLFLEKSKNHPKQALNLSLLYDKYSIMNKKSHLVFANIGPFRTSKALQLQEDDCYISSLVSYSLTLLR